MDCGSTELLTLNPGQLPPTAMFKMIKKLFWLNAYVFGLASNWWTSVPAGKHEIILRYKDWPFLIGSIFSALTLSGCLIILLSKIGDILILRIAKM
jgi:hypothetical protein